MMILNLEKADIRNAVEIHNLQVQAFQNLLNKYKDYDTNPGAEKLERTVERMQQSCTDFYFISLKGKHIGVVRICDHGYRCILKQIFILPQYQGYGYAKEVIRLVESSYPNAIRWELDTILQEEKLCYLYEKMGYKKTGQTEQIKKGMDLVFYAKDCK